MAVLLFSLALLSVAHGSSVEPVLSRCCQLGSDWGRQRGFTSCADFPAPVSSVPQEQLPLCITSADICCRRDFRVIQCRRGTNAALADKGCDVNSAEYGESYKDCCEACEVGVLAGSLGQPCQFSRFAFGLPWDTAFHECCIQASNTSSSSTAPPGQNLCEVLKGELCAHICVPTPGSFRCECHPGFSLMSDGKSCQLQSHPDRCVGNNPCDHLCTDTGFSVECSCRPGYVLESDRKTCVDIDECQVGSHSCHLKTQVCRNEPGGFSCVGTDGTNSIDGALAENELSTGKECPLGYVSNPKLGVCDDLDECAASIPPCPLPAICVNTVGSFRCQGSCPPGYVWDQFSSQCTDKDECEDGSDDCDPETEFCLNSEGGYTCLERTQGRGSCPAGYKKDPTHRSGCSDVDECREDIHGCHTESETCRNTAGAYECDPRDQRCDIGFRLNPTSRTCEDINECSEGIHTCPAYQQCVNDAGGFHCASCSPGHHFNPLRGQCQDTDECAAGTHTCSPSERCINEEGTFQCSPACEPGFKASPGAGAGAGVRCEDIDECAEGIHSCPKATQRCRNTNGSFICEDYPSCPSGSTRNPSGHCIDVRKTQFILRPSSIPTSSPTSITITSPTSSPTSSPTTSPRPSSSSSSSSSSGPSPGCPAGYHYSRAFARCLDVDECAELQLHICNNLTELCINEPGGYRCVTRTAAIHTSTTAAATTATTTTPASTTSTSPPAKNISAVQCGPGYTYSFHSGKCVDVDECADKPCDSTQHCHNSPGSYSCECLGGYVRDPITEGCVDINECQLGIAKCLSTQRCDNTIGSYQCIRFSGCGTGYTLNAATGKCEDDDECLLGTDNCREAGPLWVCRNIQGSFRCERKQCDQGSVLLSSGECKVANCQPGYEPAPNTGECHDVDECARGVSCGRGRRCVNTPGSYQCVYRIQCRPGYVPSPDGDRCVDVDECATGAHQCKPGQTCLNRPGTYQCQCPPGHTRDKDNNCVDVDECTKFPRQVCSDVATCENTVGSYHCICKQGYKQSRGNICEDIDECADESAHLCQHDCNNVWGSYRCSCHTGYFLHSDNRSCTDIDECDVHKGRHLCVGDCVNTPGSYRCSCPSGYKLGKDARVCIDIDECATGDKCRSEGETCLNMQGSYRCNTIRCPEGYTRDTAHKNRCRRLPKTCGEQDEQCLREPIVFTYNFMTMVSNLSIPGAGRLDLFVMRGPVMREMHTSVTLELVSARAGPGVIPAARNFFHLSQNPGNQAVVSLVRPIQGPQDIQLNLNMEVYHSNYVAGVNVAKLFIFVSQYEF